jgi:hypothetical protein
MGVLDVRYKMEDVRYWNIGFEAVRMFLAQVVVHQAISIPRDCELRATRFFDTKFVNIGTRARDFK